MKKILVIRIGRAGDMVMITPSLRALLDNYPEHELHILTSQDGKRVLSGFDSRVTNISVYEKKRLTTGLARLRQQKEIQGNDYKYIFNFELKLSYKNIYHGLNSLIYELDKSEEGLHYAERCLNVIQRSVDAKINNYWNWLPITADGLNKTKQLLDYAGITDDDFVIGFHPSFSGSKKRLFSNKNQNILRQWPPEYFAKLGRLIHEYGSKNKIKIKMIMDLLPEERELGENIVKMSQGSIKLLTPESDFERYKATIKRINLLVTPNTGPMHIAAAVKTCTVALFVDWNPDDCGPYMESDYYTVLRAEDYNVSENRLDAIKPEHVFRACKQYFPKY